MENHKVTDSFNRLRGKLRGIASSILKNEEDADDALQDAFCRLWTRDNNRSPACGSVDGLVVLTVKRICLDFIRARNVRRVESVSDGESDDMPESSTLWTSQEFADMEMTLMEKITPMQRRVFRMVSDGIDYDIIALRLGISEVSARQFMSRARKTLRMEYKKMIGR